MSANLLARLQADVHPAPSSAARLGAQEYDHRGFAQVANDVGSYKVCIIAYSCRARHGVHRQR